MFDVRHSVHLLDILTKSDTNQMISTQFATFEQINTNLKFVRGTVSKTSFCADICEDKYLRYELLKNKSSTIIT